MRNAITIGPLKGGKAKYAIYFGDAHANLYALNAQNCELLRTDQVDKHFTARITAAPTLYQNRLLRARVVVGRIRRVHGRLSALHITRQRRHL